MIDSKDVHFGELKVWDDANGGGVTEAGELKTLSTSVVQHNILKNNDNMHLKGQQIGAISGANLSQRRRDLLAYAIEALCVSVAHSVG